MEIDEKLKKEVWEKGSPVSDYSPDLVRQDACGAYIIFAEYGKNTPFGWEIDHIWPKESLLKKGVKESLIDDLKNLRPLQWENNLSKGNDFPSYTAAIIGRDHNYIREQKEFIINIEVRKELCDFFKLEDNDCSL